MNQQKRRVLVLGRNAAIQVAAASAMAKDMDNLMAKRHGAITLHDEILVEMPGSVAKAEKRVFKVLKAAIPAMEIPRPREQAQAYWAGQQDGQMGIGLRDVSAQAIQERTSWQGESVVCYLNGIIDGQR